MRNGVNSRAWDASRRRVGRVLRCFAALLLLAGLAGASRPAGAVTENRKKAEALFLQGVTAFQSNDLKTAVARFQEALKMDRHPVLLFNLAAVYDKLGDKANAGRFYKEYLKTLPPDDAFVRMRLKQLDPSALASLDKEIEAAKAVAVAQAGKGEGDAKEPAAPVVPTAGPSPSGHGGAGLGQVKGLTWTVVGVGVAALGTGGAFAYLTRSAVDDFNSSKLRSQAVDARDRADSHALYANIGFTVGAVALAGGVVMMISNLTAGGDEAPVVDKKGSGGDVPSLSVVPLVGPQSGVLLQGSF